MKPTLGLVIALSSEGRRIAAKGRRRRIGGYPARHTLLPDQTPLLTVHAGMGGSRALAAARRLAAQGVSALASAGVSGGLDPCLQTGDIVIADRFLWIGDRDAEGPWHVPAAAVSRAVDMLSAAEFTVRRGTVLTVEHPVFSIIRKTDLHQRFAALAVDMESAAVARGAAEAGIPFFALRVIFDSAVQSLAPEFYAALNPKGGVQYLSLAAALCRNPALIFDLVRMARRYRTALQALQAAWRILAAGGFPAGLTRPAHESSIARNSFAL